MDDDRADYDNVAWDRNDAAWEESHKELPLLSTRRRVESLVEKKFRKPATWVPKIIFGDYNALYRIRLEGVSPDVIVRLPQRNRAQFPDEKPLERPRRQSTLDKILRSQFPEYSFMVRVLTKIQTLGPLLSYNMLRIDGLFRTR
jgi:hypothetical protein